MVRTASRSHHGNLSGPGTAGVITGVHVSRQDVVALYDEIDRAVNVIHSREACWCNANGTHCCAELTVPEPGGEAKAATAPAWSLTRTGGLQPLYRPGAWPHAPDL
ncbi:hypothetical protein GUJ93_ZPchr0006g44194 [Zizania palustris]|uniref:Uncharacterized protein n=1 Tax=Zizania palustris TaxID=103762 RepID=A0A8J5VV81_ZIZPA|nr:hypothetical protein GUJ93_ZPchr0006g44194 [Zizania palustris]